MRLRVTRLKTPAAFLMLKKTGEMRLYGKGGQSQWGADDRRRQ